MLTLTILQNKTKNWLASGFFWRLIACIIYSTSHRIFFTGTLSIYMKSQRSSQLFSHLSHWQTSGKEKAIRAFAITDFFSRVIWFPTPCSTEITFAKTINNAWLLGHFSVQIFLDIPWALHYPASLPFPQVLILDYGGFTNGSYFITCPLKPGKLSLGSLLCELNTSGTQTTGCLRGLSDFLPGSGLPGYTLAPAAGLYLPHPYRLYELRLPETKVTAPMLFVPEESRLVYFCKIKITQQKTHVVMVC